MTSKTIQADVWTDVLISLLAIYGPSLEKVDSLVPAFKQAGLTSPSKVAQMSHEEVYNALVKSGYDRGNLLGIFIPRIQAVAQTFEQVGMAQVETVLQGKNIQAIEKILLPIKGIGPKVVNNFLLLRGLVES
ncbi:MAG: hypothetical protein AB7I41_06230 [Candidatus Sericytochromatia bacterium]